MYMGLSVSQPYSPELPFDVNSVRSVLPICTKRTQLTLLIPSNAIAVYQSANFKLIIHIKKWQIVVVMNDLASGSLEFHLWAWGSFHLDVERWLSCESPPLRDGVNLLSADHARYINRARTTDGLQQKATAPWSWNHSQHTTAAPNQMQHNTHGEMQAIKKAISWKLFILCYLFVEGSCQDFGGGQTQFICTSVPKDMDICTATLQNSMPGEDLKTTVMQLRETVLQQKETIMNQKETIRELTSKLTRCEGQSAPEPGPGGRRKETGTKNTMGDVSRGPSDTLAQLSQTLQSLKQRLENLEVCGEP